ncbi:YhdP family phospholipid transporter [Marinicella meishanensis]|uniref:YhdP family phospholipid transporter n=1 Tax=Marinicella meishanensis TaxID=2873263 RepID=UPI001CBE602B|nr:AsmA-like C-terminal region-containing protein [Marinicella sp. NBU2979]
MTKTRKHHWLFKLWVKLRGLLALVIVLAGVAVGILSLLLPFESLYQQRLEDFLEDQWGLAVDIEEIQGSWRGYGPHFALTELKLTGKQSVQLESADLTLNVYQMLIPGGRTGIDLSINRAELDMIRSAQGASITINDDQDEARFTETLDRILQTGSLRVEEMSLNLANEAGEVLLAGLQADLLLEQDQTERALQLLIRPGEGNQGIEVLSRGLRNQSLTRDAQWYLRFNQFDFASLTDLVTQMADHVGALQGELDGELWLQAEAGAIRSLTGSLRFTDAARDFAFVATIKHQGTAKHWNGLIRIEQITTAGVSHPAFDIHLQRHGDQTQVKSAQVPLAWVIGLAHAAGLAEPLQASLINDYVGELTLVEATYDEARDQLAHGYLGFSGVGLNHAAFQLAGLRGEVQLSADQAQVLLDSAAGQLSIPPIYRGTLNWQELTAQMVVDWSAPQPRLTVNNLWCACEDFTLSVWGEFTQGDNPHLRLTSQVTDVVVPALKKYWPYRVWNPKTMAWLDDSMLAGAVDRGYVFVQGEMVPKAFKQGFAQFVSRAYTRGIDNRFHPAWPVVEDIDAVAWFNQDSFTVDLQHAHTQGIHVGQAELTLASFDTGLINVQLQAASVGNEILDYIRRSPLVKNMDLNDMIQVGGEQAIELAFAVSTKAEQQAPFLPKGQVTFSQGQFDTEHFSLANINGPVSIKGHELSMQDLPATLSEAPVKLNGTVVTEPGQGVAIDVNLQGDLSAAYLQSVVGQALPISGTAAWNIHIARVAEQLQMTAESGLAGMAIDWPAPLQKDVATNKTLQVTCLMPCKSSDIAINYNHEIITNLQYRDGQHQLTQLQFSDGITPPEAIAESAEHPPMAPFGGTINRLDLDQWLEVLAATPSLTVQERTLPTDEWRLHVKQLLFMSRTFTDLDVVVRREANRLRIQVAGPAVEGQLLIDDNVQQKGIVAEFERLDWIEPDEDLLQQVSEGQDSSMPDLHLWAGDFSYAGIPLGDLRLEMRNVADGIKIDQLSIKSALAEINVAGVWNKADSPGGQSAFSVVMFSERIADFLKTVGFDAPITNAQTLVELNAEWLGVPSQFNIANISGDLDIKIGQGQVLDQNPGFGRVLGLFNLTNLPRRLLLDFRDVLADGLLFNSMEGHFTITDGVATTEDFLIKASSAKIHIEGDVGFADQSYAQTITVRPQIGKTFPTIGAIAGGPVGAAAGFLVQGLLDKQLNNSNEIIYRVTGTWDEPLIELISDE